MDWFLYGRNIGIKVGKVKHKLNIILFQANVPFLYPLKT